MFALPPVQITPPDTTNRVGWVLANTPDGSCTAVFFNEQPSPDELQDAVEIVTRAVTA